MEQQDWRRVFAYTGLAVIGFALAYFATAVATGGVAAGNLGWLEAGLDLFSVASGALVGGVATMAVFGFLALRLVWLGTRHQPR